MNLLYCTVLYFTLYCTLYCDLFSVLYCPVLYCTVLCYVICTIVYCTVLYCTVLCSDDLCYSYTVEKSYQKLSREEKRRQRRASAKYRLAHATRERMRVEVSLMEIFLENKKNCHPQLALY